MLRVLGHTSTVCDGISRRDLLRAGSIAAILPGSTAFPIAKADERRAPQRSAPTKAVILIDLFGGPSHIDTFDPKPNAPDGIRGEFSTIPTALPGIRICEHLPQLARRLDQLAVIRSVTHKYNSHNPYGVMTGFDGGQDQTDYFARPTNHPSVPSVCQYLRVKRSEGEQRSANAALDNKRSEGEQRSANAALDNKRSEGEQRSANAALDNKRSEGEQRSANAALDNKRSEGEQRSANAALDNKRATDLPGYVMLPAFPGYSQGLRRAGPYGGYLGPKFDPMFSTCEPEWGRKVTAGDFYDEKLVPRGEPQLPKLDGDLTLDALNTRRSLVEQLDRGASATDSAGMADKRRAAFDLLLSPRARFAFDLSKESPAIRDRYGRDLFGQSVLLARRLVEAGVTFVTVHTEAAQASGHWDTHSNNFKMLRHLLLPFLDRAVSVLIDDLTDRGLLDSTLIVVTGDMGRTPKVNGSAGRDHWPQCGFCLFAGGGTKSGIVHGATDKIAAYPVDHPVSAGDLVATVYHLVGVDPEATVPDHTGRPTHISHGGKPIRGVLK